MEITKDMILEISSALELSVMQDYFYVNKSKCILSVSLDDEILNLSTNKYDNHILKYNIEDIAIICETLKDIISSNRLLMLYDYLDNNYCDEMKIYENPKYARIIDYLKSVRDRIGKVGCYTLYDSQKALIESILTAGEVLEEHYTKYLYYLCYASYFIMGESPNKDFINAVKRIRWQPISDEYKQLIYERLGFFDAYISQNSFDVSGMVEYLNANLDYLVKSIG